MTITPAWVLAGVGVAGIVGLVAIYALAVIDHRREWTRAVNRLGVRMTVNVDRIEARLQQLEFDSTHLAARVEQQTRRPPTTSVHDVGRTARLEHLDTLRVENGSRPR